MKSIFLFLIFVCSTTLIVAQPTKKKERASKQLSKDLSNLEANIFASQNALVGTTINDVSFTVFLKNKPQNTNFNHKFKVLEFWATWCKGCLAAIPHINALQRKFSDTNIVFLSITHEVPAIANTVFDTHYMATIVVSDPLMVIHRQLKIQNYGTMLLPSTVLLDNENKIVWYGNPNNLTKMKMTKFLKKETL